MAAPRAANRPSRLNRTLLTLIGLILLIVGAAVLAFGLGLLTPLLRPMLPALDPTAPLLPTTVAMPVWAPYVAIVVAVIIGFLCLRWLVAQTQRRPRTGTWNVAAATATGRTRLAAATAADAIASDIQAYPGVRKATATLAGPRSAPALQLEVSIERDTSLAAIRDRITSHALPRLRHAMQLDSLPTQLLLRIDAADSTTPRAS
jgi:hypothetical protein